MSPGVRFRLMTGFHNAALREPPNTTRRASYKALAGLLAYGADLRSVGAALEKHTRRQPSIHRF